MKNISLRTTARRAALLALFFAALPAARAALPLDTIKLPPGFEITIFADNVKGARSLALGDKGTVFVGSMGAGNVYAIRNDGVKALEVTTVATGLDTPNGVAFHDGALYVGQVNRILRLDNIEAQLKNPPKPVLVTDKLPSDTHHGWKFIRFGPDGKLYVPVGAPCNICEKPDPYAAILRMNADGSGQEVFARGVRNTVGFDWHPQTKDLWFTDNGRDMLGDDVPPDELNRATKAGMHFGYPYCHAGDIADPEFGAKRPCSEFTKPEVRFQAHSATLGMRFYTGSTFPPAYKNQIFIAQHGSWNRSKKVGYQVVSVKIKDGKAVEEPFASGWLKGETPWGRPVDVQQMPDGALLVSDDFAGVVYRIAYKGK